MLLPKPSDRTACPAARFIGTRCTALLKRKWEGIERPLDLVQAKDVLRRRIATQSSHPAKGVWWNIEHQRNFLDQVATLLGIKDPSEWKNVKRKEVSKLGGTALFNYYPSLPEALQAAYPEVNWAFPPINPRKVPAGYWSRKSNVINALDNAERTMGITKPEDWYSVTLEDLRQIGFPQKTDRSKLAELLTERYPTYPWQKRLLKPRLTQQKRFELRIISLFPDHEVRYNERTELLNPETDHFLEIDVYIPSLKLGFEYQERHHFMTSEYTYQPVEKYMKLDALKHEIAQAKGITLITVPFWWDGKPTSLAATILKERPELSIHLERLVGRVAIEDAIPSQLQQSPASTSINSKGATSIFQVEDIGAPTTACFFTLSNVDPRNWWLFEKYDGVRAFWNPLKKAFYSRRGNKFTSFPQHIIDSMPSDVFLDGELWFGRDTFQDAMKIPQKMDVNEIDWDRFKYMVFDIPNHEGTYKARYEALEAQFKEKKNWPIEIAQKQECKDTTHMERFFQEVMDKGGEGIILRDPNAPYQPGRSLGYLKHKKYRDAEAKIISQFSPHQWECELPNGIRFIATEATKEFAKKWNPQSGDIVSFKHRGFLFANKKPKFPSLYRLRPELKWDDVVSNWVEHKPTPVTALPLRKLGTSYKPKGYWKDPDNRRKFFLDFARDLEFDPYQARNWLHITKSQIAARKGHGLLKHFGDSLHIALKQTFPDVFDKLEWPKNEKQKTEAGYWYDPINRQKGFEEFARLKGFDPFISREWDRFTASDVTAVLGPGILEPYGGSLRAARMDTYPKEVGTNFFFAAQNK